MRRAIVSALAALLVVGCQTQSTPVRLQGDPASISSLAGAWAGQYWGGATPGGSLTFTLRSGSDSLYGDVTMMDPSGQAIRPVHSMEEHRQHVRAPQQLRIDFVAIRGDSIRGTLEPYILPSCDCSASTTFVGQMRGNQLTGIFETRSAGRPGVQGTWEMKRTGGG